MSNPTSNFGWVLPTPTDLVTDLPADFEVALQGVDTTMADLKGGTTGQILSKATNTDMDFVWTSANPGDITAVNTTAPLQGGATSGAVTLSVDAATTSAVGVVQLTNSTSSTSTTTAAVPANVKTAYDLAAAAIPTSTVTTTGDIIYRNSTAPTRLGIGTTGQVLAVSGGVPTWTTLAASSPTMYEERFTSSGTWTVPSGVNNVYVMMIAGGGGGAGGGSYWGEPGKHGSVVNQMLATTPAASVSYTIGAGGAGGAATSGGDYGSASSFGSLSASGGLPGTQSLWPNSDVTRSLGSYATPITGAPVLGVNNSSGNAGTANTGGGGSSGKNSAGTASGGAGGSGFIIIRYVK
jgi:hypothetical protein